MKERCSTRLLKTIKLQWQMCHSYVRLRNQDKRKGTKQTTIKYGSRFCILAPAEVNACICTGLLESYATWKNKPAILNSARMYRLHKVWEVGHPLPPPPPLFWCHCACVSSTLLDRQCSMYHWPCVPWFAFHLSITKLLVGKALILSLSLPIACIFYLPGVSMQHHR